MPPQQQSLIHGVEPHMTQTSFPADSVLNEQPDDWLKYAHKLGACKALAHSSEESSASSLASVVHFSLSM